VKVETDATLKELFISALEKKHGGKRGEIHVSDLVYCLREAYWRKIDPAPPTEKQLSFYVDGARRHKALQVLLEARCEVPVSRWGIHGTVDMLLDGPVEIKTTRARRSLPSHYFKQLGYYAVLTRSQRGSLIVHRLNSEPPWEFYRIKWSQAELEALATEMRNRASLLRKALKQRDPRTLSPPGPDMAWKCRSCRYRNRCREETKM